MNRHELAKAFARAPRPPYARASNLWYSGDTAYSYGTPIARRLPWVYRGQRYAWVTDRKYSHSTTAHTRALASALTQANFRILYADAPPDSRDAMIRNCR